MRLTSGERTRLAEIEAPSAAVVRAALRDYLSATDCTSGMFAALIHRGESTLNMFIQDRYDKVADSDELIRKTIWDYLQRHPVTVTPRARGRLFATENYRRIRKYFLRAVQQQEVALLYGPPGTQKTFVLEHLLAEINREKLGAAVYVYASDSMRPSALLKRIGRAAGVFVNLAGVDRILNAILRNFSALPAPPAVAVDEAQHLDVHCLEILRELHDRSGCGLVLAGSHNLYENFLRGRQHLEQWLSRIDWKDPLPGLQEDEVAQIAAREFGNGQPARLSKAQIADLLHACRVEDAFARDAAGKPAPRPYLSVRRLVKFIAQKKEERAA